MFATLFDVNLTTHQPDGGVCLPTRGECDLLGMVMLDLLLSVLLQLAVHVVSLQEFIFTAQQNSVDESPFDLKLAHSIIKSISNNPTRSPRKHHSKGLKSRHRSAVSSAFPSPHRSRWYHSQLGLFLLCARAHKDSRPPEHP